MLIIDRYWYAQKPAPASQKLSPLPARQTHAAVFRSSSRFRWRSPSPQSRTARWRSPSPQSRAARAGHAQSQQAEVQASPSEMREQLSSTTPQFHAATPTEMPERMHSTSPQFSPRHNLPSPELQLAKTGGFSFRHSPRPPDLAYAKPGQGKETESKRYPDADVKKSPRKKADWHWTLRGGGGESEWSVFGDLDFGLERQRSPKPLPPPKPRLPDCVSFRKPSFRSKMSRKLSDAAHADKVAEMRSESSRQTELGKQTCNNEAPANQAKRGRQRKTESPERRDKSPERASKSPPRSFSREGVAEQIILVPSGAAQKRLQLRKAIRNELERCNSLEALQETSSKTHLAMRKGSPQENFIGSGAVAELVREALWGYKPGVLHDVWKSALQQVVGQEFRRRQDILYTLNPRSSMARGAEISVVSSRRGATVQVQARLNEPKNEADLSITKQAEMLKMNVEQREKRWKVAFCRLSQGFRLRHEDIMRALELSGISYPRREWAEEVYQVVTHFSSLTSDEYIKFVHAYAARQESEWRHIFDVYDDDKSGSIDTKELAKLIKIVFRIDPLDHVLQDLIQEVDEDKTGTVNFEEFELFMTAIVISEGFSRPERQELWKVFRRVDRAGNSHMPIETIAAALLWLGYRLSPEEMWSIAEQIDVDGSGSIDFHEFLLLMRKFREHELDTLKAAIERYDYDKTGTVRQVDLDSVLRCLNYIPDPEALSDAVLDANVPLTLTLSDLWKFLQVYRSREGLSVSECAEVDECFARYDADGQGEISTLDVGKALRWFGYQVSFTTQQQLVGQVDLDGSGRISLKELRKLIRMYWESELLKMQDSFTSFVVQDDKNHKLLTAAKVDKAFRKIDFIDASRKTPAMPSGEQSVDLQKFMSMGIAFKKAQRDIFRENGGFSHDEVLKMQRMFNEYDTDRSDSLGTAELGALMRKMFPIMNKNVRPKLDGLMKEIAQCTGKLNFADFLRTMRQFHDIQTQERLNKEAELVAETGFTPQEVQGFRELFQKSDENWDQELSLTEVKHMIANVCPLRDRNVADLVTMYKEVREAQAAKQTKFDGNQENVDFPEFLLLMKKLLDCNFANIQERLKTYDVNKRNGFLPHDPDGLTLDIRTFSRERSFS